MLITNEIDAIEGRGTIYIAWFSPRCIVVAPACEQYFRLGRGILDQELETVREGKASRARQAREVREAGGSEFQGLEYESVRV